MSNNINKKIITEEVVSYIAGLSRLSLEEKEASKFRGQLSGILGYIDQLNEVDVGDTVPTTHALPSMKNVFREDAAKESLPAEKALQNAPLRNKDLFSVPKVI